MQHFLQLLECPLLAGGDSASFFGCDVKTADCGAGSEAAGRRQMNRNRNLGPGEHKRSTF